MKKADMFWQTYLNLEKEFIDLSKYVYITDVITVKKDGAYQDQSYPNQLETFSPYIADLLIQCCVQIEALSKELYHELGGKKPRGDSSIYFDEDCLKLIDKRWKTHEKGVLVVSPFFNLTKEENRELRPLKKAHKRSGEYWEKAYQAVKHDRFASVNMGNVKALLHALAALFLLNVYYRDDSWKITYHDVGVLDMSIGSSIFSVKAPVIGDIWNENEPKESESPYIVQYEEQTFQHIKEEQERENTALKEYLDQQPEIKEQEFLLQLYEEYKRNQGGRVMMPWELGKYRINKKIPNTLSFQERKRLLLASEEWKGWIHQNNNPPKEDEITEENIQQEIDRLGIHTGMEIMKRFQPFNWLRSALHTGICIVKIPTPDYEDEEETENDENEGVKEVKFYKIEDQIIISDKELSVGSELIANTVDAAQEKHVPVISVSTDEVKVAVGSVEHPSLEAHYIEFIVLVTEGGMQMKWLKPGDKPEATFKITDKAVAAFEYCNLHGLWKAEA